MLRRHVVSINKVVWSEGLFLQPQHFQQQDRHVERYVETRCEALVGHSWGFTEIEIERDFLSASASSASGASRACFPTARRFACPTTTRCRRRSTSTRNVRDQMRVPRGAAAAVRRAGRRSGAVRPTA